MRLDGTDDPWARWFAWYPVKVETDSSGNRRFKAYRLNGEWFRRTGSLAAWVEHGCR